ncbi:hypothetical protein E2C01_047978 [Portunus trituberculatus]|uniref:Uncharacterized protein n=1 Tax=Portunus trituberculatus TaxID=210409 RepID=A0A5B7G2G6_PORTR|nr:hypothetical protein [Portunus trituberculatus]
MTIETVVGHSCCCGLVGKLAGCGCRSSKTAGSAFCEYVHESQHNAKPFSMCRASKNRSCESSLRRIATMCLSLCYGGGGQCVINGKDN